MDQKNTIVKCNRSPKCLFEHNGVCDNYVINISADGQCACYVETEESIFISSTCGDCNYFADTGLIQCPCDKHEQYVYRKAPACDDFKAKRGQRAKCNFIDDMMDIDDKHLGEAVTVKMKIAELNKPNKNKTAIKDIVPECDLPVCDWSCKHALRSGPTFNPDLWCDKMKAKPAVGLFCSDYEEEK